MIEAYADYDEEEELEEEGEEPEEKPSLTVPVNSMLSEDKTLQHILKEKNEGGSFSYPSTQIIEKHIAEEEVLPTITDIITHTPEKNFDEISLLKEEVRTIEKSSLDCKLRYKLQRLKLITKEENTEYFTAYHTLRNVINQKINIKDPVFLQEMVEDDGLPLVLTIIGPVLGTGISLLSLIPKIIKDGGSGIMIAFGILVGVSFTSVGLGIASYSFLGKKAEVKTVREKDIDPDYARFLDSLRPFKEIVEGKRAIDPEKSPHGAYLTGKIAAELKPHIDVIYSS